MLLLAIDCAANLCAANVHDADVGVERGRAVRDLGRGHAEHLIQVIGEALGAAAATYADLGAVAVSVGPGSFTGVRVGVSTARGLALALRIPAIGVTTLEAIAAETRAMHGSVDVLAVLEAGRDGIYAAVYDGFGDLRHDPHVSTLDAAAEIARREQPLLAGSAALRVAEVAGIGADRVAGSAATADIAVYARLAAARGATGEKPSPLYLRGADAKPQVGFVLPRRGP